MRKTLDIRSLCKFIQVQWFYCILKGSFQICAAAVEIEKIDLFSKKIKYRLPGAARLPHRYVSVFETCEDLSVVLLMGLSGTHQCFSVDSTHIVLKVKPLIP